MSKRRIETWVAVVLLGVGVVFAVVLGIFTYVRATATPLHPNAQSVPSVTRTTPPAKWAASVEEGRGIARTGVTGQNLPGLSVAVGVGADVVWAEGFGYSDLEKRTKVTPETLLRAGEVSIPLTSAAAGLLLENHRLHLDDRIQTYVPTFPEKQWPVTLRELMANTSGLRTDAGDEEPISERCERTTDGLHRFADTSLLFEPGTRYKTSTYGWILVSAAIEAAAGQPFFDFMRARVFEPLRMGDTIPDFVTEDVPQRSTFYFPRFGGETRYGPDVSRSGDHSCFAGASDFLSTPSDLVRFGIALDSGKLLQPATVKELQTPQRLASGEETGYGLGWKLETVSLGGAPARAAGHGTKQDFMGGTASLLTFPERGLVVAVMSNTSFADTHSLAVAIAQAFAPAARPPSTSADDARQAPR